METEYRTDDVFYWLEPMLTDEEFEAVEPTRWEAQHFALSIPTGDHWA